MKKLSSAVLLALALTGCATSPTGRRQLMLVSPDSAIVESKKAYLSTMDDLDRKHQLVTDPALVKRVQTVTGRLVTEAVTRYPNTRNWEWSVAIIDDPKTVNAWCMAGGRMAIYTGIISKLDLTDDEMAQIMGHEISHAISNHTAEQMSRAMLMNGGLMAAQIATRGNSAALSGAAMAAQVGLELPNSRTAESEADRLGIELASRAGYAPEAAVSLWQKMSKQAGGGQPQFLSTHPAPGNREKTLAELVPAMKALNPQRTPAAVHPVTIVQ